MARMKYARLVVETSHLFNGDVEEKFSFEGPEDVGLQPVEAKDFSATLVGMLNHYANDDWRLVAVVPFGHNRTDRGFSEVPDKPSRVEYLLERTTSYGE